MWKVRGGGLYACGFAVTFLVLELGSIVEDVKDIGMLLDGQIVAFVISFIVDAFENTIEAFIWPVLAVQFAPPWGAIGLGLAFVAFPKTLKPRIERWLFDGAVKSGDDESKSDLQK